MRAIGLALVVIAFEGLAPAKKADEGRADQAITDVDPACKRGSLQPSADGFVSACELEGGAYRFYFVRVIGQKAHVWRLFEVKDASYDVGKQSLGIKFDDHGRQVSLSWFFGRGSPEVDRVGFRGTTVCSEPAYRSSYLASGLTRPSQELSFATGRVSIDHKMMTCDHGIFGLTTHSGLLIPTAEVSSFGAPSMRDAVEGSARTDQVRFKIAAQRNKATQTTRLLLQPIDSTSAPGGDQRKVHFEVIVAPPSPELSCEALLKMKPKCDAATQPKPTVLTLTKPASGKAAVVVAEPPAASKDVSAAYEDGTMIVELHGALFSGAETGLVVRYRDEAKGAVAATAEVERNGWSLLGIPPTFAPPKAEEHIVSVK